jgi:hypothetical protein
MAFEDFSAENGLVKSIQEQVVSYVEKYLARYYNYVDLLTMKSTTTVIKLLLLILFSFAIVLFSLFNRER